MAFDLMDIFGIIIESLQGISILIMIFGMASAFLWKVAFYVQLGLGLIITIVVTYFIYSFTQMLRLPLTWALLVFIIGVIASLIQAARAAIMAIVNGFFLAWLGAFIFLAAGQAIDLLGLFTRLGGTLVASGTIAAILVGISAYAGGHVTSILKLPKLARSKTHRTESERRLPYTKSIQPTSSTNMEHSERKETEMPETEDEASIAFVHSPSTSSCGICREEWIIDSEVYKCSKCGMNYHRDCIQEYVKKSHRCPKCRTVSKML
jgi:DNA-directed RNA polymerase subunit RPC12/RpoP